MTTVAVGLIVEAILIAFAVLGAIVVAAPFRAKVAGIACCAACVAGGWTGVLAMSGVRGTLLIATALPG